MNRITHSDTLRAFLGAKDNGAIAHHLLIHLNIVIYALAYWMQQPVLPFLSSELGVNKSTFGMLQSTISICALIGGPLVGRLLDERGTKVAMLVSQGGSLAMYGIMAISTNVPLLFASRIPSLLQHAMLCAQAALTKLSTGEDRSLALGRLSLSYAIGMSVGAPLGGSLAKWYGSYFAAGAAFGLTLVIMVLDILYLQGETTVITDGDELTKATENDQAAPTAVKTKGLKNTLPVVLKVMRIPAVRDILIFSMIAGVGLSFYQSMFSVAAREHFKMDPQDVGFFISFGSVLGLISNVFIIGVVVHRFGDVRVISGASALLAASLFSYSFTSDYTQLVAIQIPLGLSSGVLYTSMSSLMSQAGDDSTAGTQIALSHASRSACGIVAPILGGWVYDTWGFQRFGQCAAIMLLGATVYFESVAHSPHFLEISTKAHSKRSS
eukprot:GEMP01024489.1.p1 GENE.GEMP01024489.1~~GEMP01024489.1.p1  ORF type:complete len:438 (+),score=77.20 GEMP01024489.1:759-2072(+)